MKEILQSSNESGPQESEPPFLKHERTKAERSLEEQEDLGALEGLRKESELGSRFRKRRPSPRAKVGETDLLSSEALAFEEFKELHRQLMDSGALGDPENVLYSENDQERDLKKRIEKLRKEHPSFAERLRKHHEETAKKREKFKKKEVTNKKKKVEEISQGGSEDATDQDALYYREASEAFEKKRKIDMPDDEEIG